MTQLMRRTKWKRGTTCLWTLLILVLFPLSAQAQDSHLSFYVTPEFPESQVEGSESYFDLNLAPGAKDSVGLTLQNAGSEPIQVQITPHTAYTNVHGVVEYGKDAEAPDTSLVHSLADLIEASETIDLAGNETKTIQIPLHMPADAFEGFLAGGLRITEVKKDEDETPANQGEGVAIKNEFAYVVGVVVSNSRDSVQPDLDLLDVFADQLNYRNVISATIQNFTPTFVNRLAVEATVQRVGEDEVLYEASEEGMQMAPNSHFHFPISLEGGRFQSGDYLLKLTATSGEEEWTWEQEFTIDADEARALNRQDVMIDTSLNWWMIVSIVVIISLIIVILWMKIKQKKKD
ncbi:hypothetical protein A5876_003385 [Enterococcus sp. 3C8_DIV0646]|nr:hypothetical protein A5876_003385 [Enterococcus sp. 3C8_DIV0646]